jgi:serine/threonine protein phosphatase PrpC
MKKNFKIIYGLNVFLPMTLCAMEAQPDFNPKFHIAVRQHLGGRHRNNQEDTFVVGPDVIGIFDGHGGKQVSEHAAQHINRLFKEARASGLDTRSAMVHAVGAIENHFNPQSATKDAEFSAKRPSRLTELPPGSTVVMLGIDEQGMVHIGGVGDSRAHTFVKTEKGYVRLRSTKDHKPCRQEEAERIFQNGGFIRYSARSLGANGLVQEMEVSRSWFSLPEDFASHPERYHVYITGRVGDGPVPGQSRIGNIAMTRSLGDVWAKKIGVTAEPEFLEPQPFDDNTLFFLASDGVSDAFDDSQVEELLNEFMPLDDQELEKRCEGTYPGMAVDNNQRLSMVARLIGDRVLRTMMDDNVTLMLIQKAKNQEGK